MRFFPTREIVLAIGPLAIHWYGLMYLFAFLLVWWMLPRLQKFRGLALTAEQRSSLLTYGILGTLLGGRLGYVLFYGAEYYGEHLGEILAVWKGGMSFHGGFLGVIIATMLFARKEHIDLWKLADVLVIPIAIGLALGRVGNFINQELYGPVTSLPWGIAIPGAEGLRHPTPLYAILKDLSIAGACFLHLRLSSNTAATPLDAPSAAAVSRGGTTFALFLVLYGILRFFIEYVRIETAPGFDFGALHLTRGQALSLPLLLAGIGIMWSCMRRGGRSA